MIKPRLTYAHGASLLYISGMTWLRLPALTVLWVAIAATYGVTMLCAIALAALEYLAQRLDD